jgi:phosphoserine phosphatase RsbU/P
VLVLPDAEADPVRASLLIAGHPLPLLVRAGEVKAVGRPGPLVGTLERPRGEVTPVELSQGDQLVLYTDGVTEARDDAGVQFGEAGLIAVLRGTAGLSADGTVAAVSTAVETQLRGSRYGADDQAVLALGC